MSQKLKTSTLKSLQKVWYKKLEKAGFHDIEADEFRLKSWSSELLHDKYLNTKEAKESYYQMATSFLNDYIFENERERLIWEYHSNGISYRNISRTLKKAKVRYTGRTKICGLIKRLRSTMFELYKKQGRFNV